MVRHNTPAAPSSVPLQESTHEPGAGPQPCRAGVDARWCGWKCTSLAACPPDVGLAETSVRESRERVRAALLCARFDFPQRRITLNLAPADLPKEGGRYDLAIALGILAASGQVDPVAAAV